MTRAGSVAEKYSGWIPWTIAALYSVVYGCLGIIRYRTYHASCDDGLFLQSISSAFHGFHNTPEGVNHFAYHFSPILYLLAPVIWIWRSAIALILVQALAGGLTIPPIYSIARRRLPILPSALVGVIAGLYPPLGGVAFVDFSENALAPAAAAWLLWAIDARRMPAAIVFALICLGIKEDQSTIMAVLGTVGTIYFIRLRDTRWASFSASLVVLSIVTFTAFMTIVRPATGVWYGYPSIRDFYGGMNPLPLIAGLFSAPKIAYVFAALVPLLGICLLSRCMILAIPGMLECLLSRVPVTYTIGQHYAATWIPYVLTSFAIGISILWRKRPKIVEPVALLLLAINLYINFVASPNLWSANLSQRLPEHDTLDAFIRDLPESASITAFCPVFAHLGMFPNATVYAKSPTRYIVIYSHRDVLDWDRTERNFIDASKQYRVILRSDGVEIYQRNGV